jgi:hypothetical protein
MTFEGGIAADTVVIHPVTIPEEFARGGSSRSVTVSLAFDPEVRRTRREYLAGRMSFDLVRNMSIDDIRAIWVRQPDDRALRLDLPNDRRRPKLEPGLQDSQDSTLQVRTLRRNRLDPDDGDTYYVVVRHTSSAWVEGGEQRYALVVALEDEERVDLDLYATLAARLPVRLRVRS